MSEAALFISWGQPVHGREKRAGNQMRESIAYCRQLEKEKRLGRAEWASLPRQGGDLWGIGLLRGTPEQLDALRRTEDFSRWIIRLTLVCENVSVVDAAVDEKLLALGMDLYDDVVKDLDQESVDRPSPRPARAHASEEERTGGKQIQ